ncbi:MAG: hypothetical protein HZB14_09395 [Actinobacteria bacterium]|nr:hypothetical protein [Actinomycetota bacterium]
MAYAAIACTALSFEPTFDETFSNPAAGELTQSTFTTNLPLGSSAIKRLALYLTPTLGWDFPAMGTTADRCPASSITSPPNPIFTPTSCPPQARVGSVSMTTPLLAAPVTGALYIIEKSPLPWLGIAIDQAGAGLYSALAQSAPQVDVACDPIETGWCPSQIAITVLGLPEIPLTELQLKFGHEGRVGANGSALSDKFFKFVSAGDPACESPSQTRVVALPYKSTTATELYDAVGMSGCSAGDPPNTTLTSSPQSPTNDSTPTFEFISGDPLATFECKIDAAAYAPCVSPFTPASPLSDGSHRVRIRAVGEHGPDPSPLDLNFVVDTVAPEYPNFTFFTDDVTVGDEITVDWTPSEDAFMQCRPFGGEWAECPPPFHVDSLAPGEHTYGFKWQDDAGNVSLALDYTWTLLAPPPPADPVVTSSPTGVTNATTASIAFSQSEGRSVECSLDLGTFSPCESPFVVEGLQDGAHTVSLRAVSGAQYSSTVGVAWTVDTVAPAQPALTASPDIQWPHSTSTFEFTGEAGARFECKLAPSAFKSCSSPKQYDLLDEGAHHFEVRQIDEAGNRSAVSTYDWTVTVGPETAPPTAPALDQTVTTPFADRVGFLYEGPDAIQQGVEAGAIVDRRVAVVRGRVRNTVNDPLPGVRVSVVGHPEFGASLSRDDGEIYLAVNGGGRLTLRFEKAGYPAVDRSVEVPWRDYVFADDVVMTTLDPVVSDVQLGGGTQVAEGSTVADADGVRRAAVVFPQGTTAQMRFPDGETQPLSDLDVRITEFTVGDNGPDAMPAGLPATSSYTYASEFSVDQALVAGADTVEFSQPVWAILENFIGFPAGTTIPNGYYDRYISGWRAQDDGEVMKVLSVQAGVAVLDDGSGQPMPEPPPSDPRHDSWSDVMAYVGQRFQPGESFWMVPLEHFSPYDFNLPATFPEDMESTPTQNSKDKREKDPCKESGSIIECENQTLGETIPIPGTSMSLNYRSDRAPGRTDRSRFETKLTDSDPATSLELIELTIDIEGKRHEFEFAPSPNASYTFQWDGRDASGRQLVGTHTAYVVLKHLYPITFGVPSTAGSQAWARVSEYGAGDLDVRRTGVKAIVEQRSLVQVEAPPATPADWKSEPVAGWDISSHHRFDPIAQTTLRGDGTREHPDELSKTFSRFAGLVPSGGGGGGEEVSLYGPPFDADGVATIQPTSLLRPLVSMLPIAAVGAPDQTDPFGIGDGGQARDAQLGSVQAIATSSDGSMYAAEEAWNDAQQLSAARIRRIDADGVITTVAGNGEFGEAGDGGLAVDAQITKVTAMTVGHRGELYFVQGNRVRRIETDGTISTFAGQVQEANGTPEGDGGPATEALLNQPLCIAPGIDGSLFICDGSTLRQVDLSGAINTVVQLDFRPYSYSSPQSLIARSIAIDSLGAIYVGGDYALLRVNPSDYSVTVRENLYSRPELQNPCVANVGIAPDDRLYLLIAENFGAGCEDRIGYAYLSHPRDGLRRLVSDQGGNPDMFGVEGGYAQTLASDPSGDLYSAFSNQIWKYGAEFTDHMPDGATIPDPSGDVAYKFDASGRHLETTSTTTGATLTSFAYDAQNRLTGVTDADGNTVTIERNAQGDPTAIVAPFGQRTTLAIGADGLLGSVTTPGGRSTAMTYDSKGLLETFTKPNGATSTFAYDGAGRLLSDQDAAGSAKTLDLEGSDAEYSVTLRSAGGREKVVTHRTLSDGSSERVVQHPTGTQSQRLERTDGSKSMTLPDGTAVQATSLPDDRYGPAVQVPSTATITTPGGLSSQVETSVEHDVSAWWNPLSWNTETATTSVNGKTSTSTLNRDTQTAQSSSPAGRTSTSTFDDVERPVTLDIPGLAQASFAYDANGRLTQASQGSRASSFSYNADGELAQATDPLGRTTSYAYDNDGLVTSTTLPGGREIQFTYDANGNMTSLTPPSRPAHEFSYDILGLMTGATMPEVSTSPRTTTYAYATPDHDLTKVTRPDGQEANFTYDSAGRLAALTGSEGQSTFSYSPTTGNPTDLTSPDNENLSLTFDGSLPTGQTLTGPVQGSSTLAYNNDFQMTSATTAGSQVNYSYDADGLPIQAGDLTLASDPANGLLKTLTLGNAVTQITHNPFGEPESIDTDVSATDLFQLNLTRDNAGRITTKQEIRPSLTTTWTYNYDTAGRLENVLKDGNQYAAYTYDANGNRTSKTVEGTPTYATFDSRDRMLTQGDFDLTYNENGELTAKHNRVTGDTLTLDYTTLGDLKGATAPDGSQIEYLLDGAGRRVGKKIDGQLTQGLLYSPEAFGPVAELDGSNNLVARFIYGQGSNVPDYMVKGGDTYRLVADQLGSVVMVVNASTGAIAQEISYGPFGEVLADSDPGFQPFGFAGGIYDVDTGLMHFGAREYDAGLARWTASDPIGFEGGDSNLYGYVLQDPVNAVDPEGTFSVKDAACALSGACLAYKGYQAAKNNLGPAAEEAAKYYANVTNDPNASGLAKAGAWAGGLLASLATCENFDETALVLATAGMGGGAAAPVVGREAAVEAAVGARGASAARITFGHGARHLEGVGLSSARVESAIAGQVQSQATSAGATGQFWGRVMVDGRTIEYRAFTRPDGTINVGTYYPVAP